MADYGLMLGSNIISNTYRNYKLKEIVTVAINKAEYAVYTGSFNLSDPNDLFFVIPNGVIFGLWTRSLTKITLCTKQPTSLQVYIYTLNEGVIDNNNYGILVFNQNNQKTFDSRFKYLRILKQYFDNAFSLKEEALPNLSNGIYGLMPTSMSSTTTELTAIATPALGENAATVSIFNELYGATITNNRYKSESFSVYKSIWIDSSGDFIADAAGGYNLSSQNITGSFLLAIIRT